MLADADTEVFLDVDRLVGTPLSHKSQVSSWLAQYRRKLNNMSLPNFKSPSNPNILSDAYERILVDSVVTQVTIPELRKELDWMCVRHGYSLQTVLNYLDLVAVTDNAFL